MSYNGDLNNKCVESQQIHRQHGCYSIRNNGYSIRQHSNPNNYTGLSLAPTCIIRMVELQLFLCRILHQMISVINIKLTMYAISLYLGPLFMIVLRGEGPKMMRENTWVGIYLVSSRIPTYLPTHLQRYQVGIQVGTT